MVNLKYLFLKQIIKIIRINKKVNYKLNWAYERKYKYNLFRYLSLYKVLLQIDFKQKIDLVF